VLEVEELSKAFGALRAVDSLTFVAETGKITSIIGPNGAGKSTAFDLISGAMKPDRGVVRWHGRDVTGMAPQRLRHLGVARSFQITNLFFGLTALENVRLAAQAPEPRKQFFSRLKRMQRPLARAEAMLNEFGLMPHRDKLARNLSHGDQRRLEIAVCMAYEPDLLMLDEPTQGMSPAETQATDELIRSLTGRVSILLVEHDVDLVMSLSDRIVVMQQGAKIAEGPPAEIKTSRRVQEAYLGSRG
jgi:branched-chain amino acid transport system ATP-binding protein